MQTQQSIRLGYWMDWSDSYYTMSDENNYTIWAFLKKCHEKGWVYKGTDVMPWCGRCGTGLSQHEIAGVCNSGGNVVGLMPHPEHAVESLTGPSTDGLGFFTSVLAHLSHRPQVATTGTVQG